MITRRGQLCAANSQLLSKRLPPPHPEGRLQESFGGVRNVSELVSVIYLFVILWRLAILTTDIHSTVAFHGSLARHPLSCIQDAST